MRRGLALKPCIAIVLGLGLAGMGAAPALAFWERSQWSRCSDAPTVAEWNSLRCPAIDPYHDAGGYSGHGDLGGGVRGGLYPQDKRRRGGLVVQRLG